MLRKQSVNTQPIEVKNRAELRLWFKQYAKTEDVCWVVCRRGKINSEGELSYLDVVEEALCFGWIDSTCRTYKNGQHLQRLSKRKRNSPWSELNKARAKRLKELGLMTEAGEEALSNAKQFTIDEDIVLAFHNNPTAWNNFCKFPPLYQRVRIDTVQRDKKKISREVFEKRIAKLIENSEQNKMFGLWNDDGLLI